MTPRARSALASTAFFAACGVASATVWVSQPTPKVRPLPIPALTTSPPPPAPGVHPAGPTAAPVSALIPAGAETGEGEIDEASLDVQASPPRYLPDTYSGDPITRMPWISPTQFIKMSQITVYGPNTTVLAVTNVATGAQTPLGGLETVIRRNEGIAADGTRAARTGNSPMGLSFSPYSTRLSPDGRWLLWPSRAEDRPVWTAMTLDGSRRIDWPRHTSGDNGQGGAGWMRDSIHFAEISEQWTPDGFVFRAYVCGLGVPGQARVFPLTPPRPGFLLPPFPNSEVLFTGDGHGWVMGWPSDRYEIIPGPTAWALRPTPLFEALAPAIVGGSKPDDSALSPDGSRLVWHDNPDGRAGRTRLFLSRPDGSDARVIFETPQRLGYGSSFCPQWMPDGGGIVIHWHGSNPISNAPNGDGLYLLTLSPAETPPAARAAARVTLGLFPACPGPRPAARLRLAGF